MIAESFRRLDVEVEPRREDGLSLFRREARLVGSHREVTDRVGRLHDRIEQGVQRGRDAVDVDRLSHDRGTAHDQAVAGEQLEIGLRITPTNRVKVDGKLLRGHVALGPSGQDDVLGIGVVRQLASIVNRVEDRLATGERKAPRRVDLALDEIDMVVVRREVDEDPVGILGSDEDYVPLDVVTHEAERCVVQELS